MQRTLREVTSSIVARLAPKFGDREAAAMARIIFENLKGWTPVDLAIRAQEPLSDFIQEKVDQAVGRILTDEPIQYVFGNAHFYGMSFRVTPDTLIPRPETAELVDLIVKENQRKDLKVIDFGTGSGCIAVALARNLPFAEVTAVDISAGALAVARDNAQRLRTKVNFVQADITGNLAEVGEGFDIVVSNPPYVLESERSDMEPHVLGHEPHSALFVPDSDPLRFYRAVMQWCIDGGLADGGKVYFEINPLEVNALQRMVYSMGYFHTRFFRDMQGAFRFLRVTR